MTDAHTHIGFAEDAAVTRRFLCAARTGDWPALETLAEPDVAFFGVHPWFAEEDFDEGSLDSALERHPHAGVGEIGLDRLRDRTISTRQRELFACQLEVAARRRRPVVLHGAKCWGEVVKECRNFVGAIPAFLFHGFSRSEGLLHELFAMNGFVSVNASILNDHAVNYRAMVRALPHERVLVETDGKTEASLAAVAAALDVPVEVLDANAARFVEAVA